MPRYALFLVGLSAVAFGADPTPKRPADGLQRICGWVDNPTPANWAITDKHGTWVIGVQGGYQADGELPDFDQGPAFWQKTNGSHGYGCGCLTAKLETMADGEKRVVRYTEVKVLRLSKCKADKALPQGDRR